MRLPLHSFMIRGSSSTLGVGLDAHLNEQDRENYEEAVVPPVEEAVQQQCDSTLPRWSKNKVCCSSDASPKLRPLRPQPSRVSSRRQILTVQQPFGSSSLTTPDQLGTSRSMRLRNPRRTCSAPSELRGRTTIQLGRELWRRSHCHARSRRFRGPAHPEDLDLRNLATIRHDNSRAAQCVDAEPLQIAIPSPRPVCNRSSTTVSRNFEPTADNTTDDHRSVRQGLRAVMFAPYFGQQPRVLKSVSAFSASAGEPAMVVVVPSSGDNSARCPGRQGHCKKLPQAEASPEQPLSTTIHVVAARHDDLSSQRRDSSETACGVITPSARLNASAALRSRQTSSSRGSAGNAGGAGKLERNADDCDGKQSGSRLQHPPLRRLMLPSVELTQPQVFASAPRGALRLTAGEFGFDRTQAASASCMTPREVYSWRRRSAPAQVPHRPSRSVLAAPKQLQPALRLSVEELKGPGIWTERRYHKPLQPLPLSHQAPPSSHHGPSTTRVVSPNCDACRYCEDTCEEASCTRCVELRKVLAATYDPRRVAIQRQAPISRVCWASSSTSLLSAGRVGSVPVQAAGTDSLKTSDRGLKRTGSGLQSHRDRWSAGAEVAERESRLSSGVSGHSIPDAAVPSRAELQSLKALRRRYCFTPCEIARHHTEEDCWIVAHGKVYDVTRFLKFHPAGVACILNRTRCQDASRDFDFHSYETRTGIWPELCIGRVVACPGWPGSDGLVEAPCFAAQIFRTPFNKVVPKCPIV